MGSSAVRVRGECMGGLVPQMWAVLYKRYMSEIEGFTQKSDDKEDKEKNKEIPLLVQFLPRTANSIKIPSKFHQTSIKIPSKFY